jgi:hypothetical protein
MPVFILVHKPLDAQRAELDAALATIAHDRAAAQSVLDGVEQRREKLLRDDVSESDIAKLDAEGDHARIRIEKCDAFEVEIQARLSEVEGAEAEGEWRKLFDERHEAACTFASHILKRPCALMSCKMRQTQPLRIRSAAALRCRPHRGRWSARLARIFSVFCTRLSGYPISSTAGALRSINVRMMLDELPGRFCIPSLAGKAAGFPAAGGEGRLCRRSPNRSEPLP